jgi:transposase InsO family protein
MFPTTLDTMSIRLIKFTEHRPGVGRHPVACAALVLIGTTAYHLAGNEAQLTGWQAHAILRWPFESRKPHRLSSPIFCAQRGFAMWFWSISLALAIGLGLGRWSVRHYRRDRIAWAQRRLQSHVLSLELKSLRQKVVSAQGRRTPPAKRRLARKLPTLKWWQRRLIAWLRLHWPWLTRFMRVTPRTYVRWLQAKGRKAHTEKIAKGKARGRPPTPQFIVDAIVAIKRENTRYSAGHIARMISGGELKFRISKKTVAQILKAHGLKPRPKSKRPPREDEPGWLTTLYNQHVMAIDFKTALDLAGNTLYTFNLIDHGRRVLHWSRATYHPTAEWVTQQLRNAFMDMDDLPEAIVMDRDSIFLPIVKQTLPAMGIKVIRVGYKCPWQNAVVERFHRTLSDELLRYVQPINDRHLNRLLTEFRNYYNTARPHMANGAEPPVLPDVTNSPAVNDPDFFKTPRKLARKRWLGGLHSSYRWAA